MNTMHPPGVVPPGGEHLIVDLYNCDQIGDMAHVRQVCLDAATATGATVVGSPVFHHFGDGCGLTGVVILAESHLSVHTWPEDRFASVDIYVCGNCRVEAALPVLTAGLKAAQVSLMMIKRGSYPLAPSYAIHGD